MENTFKYLGAMISSEGSSTEKIKTRNGFATSAIVKLNNISTATKIKLFKSLLTYRCESLTSEIERWLKAFEQ